MIKKKTLLSFLKKKREKIPVTWVTSYDFPFSRAAELAGIDMILVGDSGGMVQLGYSSTHPVTMEEMITMSKAVRRGAPNTFIIGDMPQGSYEVSDGDAVKNALRFIKEAECDAVKCEGGLRVESRIRAMVNAGILVFGHLGLTPQSAESFGGYHVQGKTVESFDRIYEDFLSLSQAGICGLLLEGMPSLPSSLIAGRAKFPVYGIGAGAGLDGQLIIMHDLLGLYPVFRPYFAKCFIPHVVYKFTDTISNIPDGTDLKIWGIEKKEDGLLYLAQLAIQQYIKEVLSGEFPGKKYSYPLSEEEFKLLQTSKYWEKHYD